MERSKKYYVYSVRVNKKGQIIYKEKIRRIWTQEQIQHKEKQLIEQFGVTHAELGFSYEVYAGFGKTCSMLLDEMRTSLYNVMKTKK